MDNLQEDIRAIAVRVLRLEHNHDALRQEVRDNTKLTKEIKANTEDIVAFTLSLKGFVRVTKVLGVALAWFTPIGAFVLSLWIWMKGGRP